METGWSAIAPGIQLRRYQTDDLTVVVIEGPDGLTVVDSRGSGAQAEQLLADIASLTTAPVVALINTHAHYDHTFGNHVFSGVDILGHRSIQQHFTQYEEPRLLAWRADPAREPDKRWEDVVLTPPTLPVSDALAATLGGRDLELIPLSPGHTDTDLAIFVPDARLWIVGDVVEQSGPPMFGSGCYPLGWPEAVRRLADRIEPDDTVVPGHGSVVDRQFVLRQASELGQVADAIERSFESGSAIEAAIASHDLGWPEFLLRTAFERGYQALSS